jgi:hypothetical protein
MERELITIEMVANMKGIGLLVIRKGSELLLGQMVTLMRVNFIEISVMVSLFSFII